MIIVLFHVICLLGKFVYQKYQCNKRKLANDEMQESEETQANPPSDIFRMVDPTANDDEDYETSSSLRFYPPAYMQRYTAVCDVLTDPRFQTRLRKVVDFGCSELGFIKHLKNVPGIEEILCVDVDGLVLELNMVKAEPLVLEYVMCRPAPLVIEICKGSVTESDKKLEGTDAVICIELIEHLYPDTLTDLPYNIFGFIKPQVAVITTPNADFNVLFPNFSGFRHFDHKFEWTRQQFQDWAENVVLRYPNYEVSFHGICYGPKGTEHLGACSQMAVFTRICDTQTSSIGIEGLYKTVALFEYPYKIDNRSDEQKILDEATYHIQKLSYQDGEMLDQVPLSKLIKILEPFSVSMEALRTILVDGGRTVEDTENGPVVIIPEPSESDFSGNDDFGIDESSMNEDVDNYWDMGTGPLRGNDEELLARDVSVEDWNNDHWGEPRGVIAQQDYGTQDDIYTSDDQNNSGVTEQPCEDMEEFQNGSGDAEMPYYPSDNIRDISTNPALPNILNPHNGNDPDRSLDHNYSVSSNTDNLNGTRESSSANDHSAIQRLNRMMNVQAYPSISQSSTSPEPYLLQNVHMDRMLRGNQSMSNDCTLNSTFHNFDISEEEIVRKNDTISEEDELLDEQFEENQDLQRASGSNYVHLSEPQFTSSPKIDAKVALKGSKRRSLVYPTQFNSEQEETSEAINMATRRMETIALQDDEAEADSSSSITDIDTSASVVILDETNSSIPESWIASSPSWDKRRKLIVSEVNIPDTKEQIGTNACDNEVEDSYSSTKETAETKSNINSPKVFKNDGQICDVLATSYKRKSKGLSSLQINNDHSPEDISSPAVTDSGYPNSASTEGTTSEYELPSIDDAEISSDCEPSTVIEARCFKDTQEQIDNLESEKGSYTAITGIIDNCSG